MTQFTQKKIGMISARSAYMDSEACIMNSPDGRLVNFFASRIQDFGLAVFSNPERNDRSTNRVNNYSLQIDKSVKVHPLPFPMSHKGGLINFLTIRKIIKQLEQEYDILIIQLPLVCVWNLLFVKKPVLYHVCANVITGAANPLKYKGPMRLVSITASSIIHRIHRYLFSKAKNRIIVNGRELNDLYRAFKPTEVVSSSILAEEIISERDIGYRSPQDSFNLLFVGRASYEKGINYFFQCVLHLLKEGVNVEANLIGVREADLRILPDSLVQEVRSAGSRIHFFGTLNWGEEFKSIVMKSHCLLLCSVAVEGTPRVLIEARALGCPVITTDIGGVMSSVEHGKDGYIVKKGKTDEMIGHVKELYGNENLRQEIIRNGILRVRSFTLENFGQKFLSILQAWKQ